MLIQLVLQIIAVNQLDTKPETWPIGVLAVLLLAHSLAVIHLLARGRLDVRKVHSFKDSDEFLKHFLARSTAQSRACNLLIGLALMCISYEDQRMAKHFKLQTPAQKLVGVLAMASVFIKQTSVWQSLFLLVTSAVSDVLCTVSEANQKDETLQQALETYWLALSASFVIRSALMLSGLAGVRKLVLQKVQSTRDEERR